MLKRKSVVFGIVVALLLSLVVAGAVLAQGPANRPADAPFVDEDGDGVCDVCGQAAGSRTMGGRWAGRGGLAFGQNDAWHGATLVSVAAEQLGVTVQELVAELEGKTLEQVIIAHGGDPAAVVDAYLATREAVLDQLVADGRITQAQADTMLARMAEEANEHLTTVGACGGECAGECGGSLRQMPPRGGRGMGNGAAPTQQRVAPRGRSS